MTKPNRRAIMGQRPYAKGRKVRKKERITFMKVLLILSDGMRPDGLDAHPAAARLMREGKAALEYSRLQVFPDTVLCMGAFFSGEFQGYFRHAFRQARDVFLTVVKANP